MKQGKSVKLGIVIALFLLVVGFASVSASLAFNGTAKFQGNATDFDNNIRFVGDTDEAKKATITSSTGKEGATVEVSSDGKTLTFVTPIMDTVNETTTVTYNVENRSQYDAKLGTIVCTPTASNNELLEYLDITPSTNYKDLVLTAGSDATPTQTADSANIVVKLKKAYASDEVGSVTITCTLPAEAVQN